MQRSSNWVSAFVQFAGCAPMPSNNYVDCVLLILIAQSDRKSNRLFHVLTGIVLSSTIPAGNCKFDLVGPVESTTMQDFALFFKTATGNSPFIFQKRFAEVAEIPRVIQVPSGLGKTATMIVGWLWRRFHSTDEVAKVTPRRLVYCLPMRTLVEQTAELAKT